MQFVASLDRHSSIEELAIYSGKNLFSRAVAYAALINCETLKDALTVQREVSLSEFKSQIDTFIIDRTLSKGKKIGQLFFDMDSTLIDMEVIVALADHAGKAEEVAQITEAAMRGELNFSESLIKRVERLKGLPSSIIQAIQATLPLNIGAELLAEFMKEHAIKGYILSGGFTYFTQVLVEKLNFITSKANNLVISDNGVLTGEIKGEIVDAQAKADFVLSSINSDTSQHMVVGDGANDLKMMATTSYSVAFKAKEIVNKEAAFIIKNTSLDAIIYILRAINKQ